MAVPVPGAVLREPEVASTSRTESSCSYEESRSFCRDLGCDAQASVCHQQWPHFILIQSAIESRNSP